VPCQSLVGEPVSRSSTRAQRRRLAGPTLLAPDHMGQGLEQPVIGGEEQDHKRQLDQHGRQDADDDVIAVDRPGVGRPSLHRQQGQNRAGDGDVVELRRRRPRNCAGGLSTDIRAVGPPTTFPPSWICSSRRSSLAHQQKACSAPVHGQWPRPCTCGIPRTEASPSYLLVQGAMTEASLNCLAEGLVAWPRTLHQLNELATEQGLRSQGRGTGCPMQARRCHKSSAS
jgi:hypothetical protein